MPIRDAMGRFIKGYHPETEFKKGNEGYWTGKKRSQKTKDKIREALTDYQPSIGTINNLMKISKDRKDKTYEEIYGVEQAKEMRRKQSESHKGEGNPMYGKQLTKEHIKKCMRRRIPSSLEKKFQAIINKHNLPYKFVGDGSFIIGHRNPDFINTNSKKIAVEVYARYYKKRHKLSIEEWKAERTKIFREYGWEIIYFDEVQVKENYVLATLGGEIRNVCTVQRI